MADLVRYALGPVLYRIYFRNEGRLRSKAYEARGLEQCGDGIIKVVTYAWSMCYYTSPALCFYMFRKGFFTHAGVIYLSKFVSTALVVMLGAYFIRGWGRYFSQDYRDFLDVLVATKAANTEENKKRLSMYDFAFYEWPADYTWSEALKSGDTSKSQEDIPHSRHRSLYSRLWALPCDALGYFAAHVVGRPLMFPGSVGLLQAALAEPILSGRTTFIEKGGRRAKLLTADGNHIDSMFMDKRSSHDPSHKGNTLVISCEGNAGFYELGLISTPLKAGYSVLGWNHPGFSGSTGLPFPEAEQHAVDVVIQYAVNKLGFPLTNIVLYAWSIGGYSASWAAMAYPGLGGVVLDATFDDIVPLAQSKMPEVLGGFITRVVKDYFNLDNIKHLYHYPGPVLLIRRMRDEIITLEEGDISSNLGNILLVKLLRHRYPNLMDSDTESVLWEYLAAPDQNVKQGLWKSMNIDVEACKQTLNEYTEQRGKIFPMIIGHDMSVEKRSHLLMFLVLQYLMDFDAAHCIPLPSSDFRLPSKI